MVVVGLLGLVRGLVLLVILIVVKVPVTVNQAVLGPLLIVLALLPLVKIFLPE